LIGAIFGILYLPV